MERYIRNNPHPWTAVGTQLSQVDSTNAEVQRRLRAAAKTGEPIPEGSSVRADFQREGRGRHARHWEGEAGSNLAVSYALGSAGLPPERLFALSQNLALVVRDLVEELTAARGARVKWPNDVYLGERKVAGLLIETTLGPGGVACVVAGIGLNVNQTDFATAPQATSLRLAGARRLDVDEVWRHLTTRLQAAHERLRGLQSRGDLYPLQRDYHAQLYGLGHLGRYRAADGEAFAAKLAGVGGDGRLLLERDGEQRAYTLDEVRLEQPIAYG